MEKIKKNIEEALKGTKILFNFYIGVYSVFFIKEIIRVVGQFYGEKSAPESGLFEIMKFVVPKDYFSLVFGILFGAFLGLLFFKINLIKKLLFEFQDQIKGTFFQYIKYYPWLASPFSQFRWGYRFFWISLLIGFANLLSYILSHFFYNPDLSGVAVEFHAKKIFVFRAIAVFDLGILVAGIYMIFKIRADIKYIRKIILADLSKGT